MKYREKGVLRRLSTTPANPWSLLTAQLTVNMGVAVVSVIVLIVVGNVVFQIPVPQDPLGFAAAFLLGMSALFALGLLVAAVAPTPGIATALFVPLFALVMFLGGVYLPREMLPDFLIRIGDLHAARRPGAPRCLVGDVTAASPARGHGARSRSSAGRGRTSGSAGNEPRRRRRRPSRLGDRSLDMSGGATG